LDGEINLNIGDKGGITSISHSVNPYFSRVNNSVHLPTMHIGEDLLNQGMFASSKRIISEDLWLLVHELTHYSNGGDFQLKTFLDGEIPDVESFITSPSFQFVREWLSDLATTEVGAMVYDSSYTSNRIKSSNENHYLFAKKLDDQELDLLGGSLARFAIASGLDANAMGVILRNELLLHDEMRGVEAEDEFVVMLDILKSLTCEDSDLDGDKPHELLTLKSEVSSKKLLLQVRTSMISAAKKMSQRRPLVYHFDDAWDQDCESGHGSLQYKYIWIDPEGNVKTTEKEDKVEDGMYLDISVR